MAKLFGFSLDDPNESRSPDIVSPVPPNNEDGVDYYISSGFYGQYVDIEGVYKTEYDLIRRYREMSLHPECDRAIEDIVNEAIVSDLYDSPVEIELSNLRVSDSLKTKIREEFHFIKELMDFDKKAHEVFRNWYVDGRVYYHKLIDLKRPQDGIQEIRYIDAAKIKFIREKKKKDSKSANLALPTMTEDPTKMDFPEIEEYFMYNPRSTYGATTFATSQPYGQGIKIAKDAITYVMD